MAHAGGCRPPYGTGMAVGTTRGRGSILLRLLSSLSPSNRNQAHGRKWNQAINLRGIFLTLTLRLTACWWGPSSLVYSATNKTWKPADLEPKCVAEYESRCFLRLWFTHLEHWDDCVTQNEVCKVLGTPQPPSVRRDLITHSTSALLVTRMQASVADPSFLCALLLGCESEVPLVGWDVFLCPGGLPVSYVRRGGVCLKQDAALLFLAMASSFWFSPFIFNHAVNPRTPFS